ncbi:MAG: hypothetical protein P8N02_08145 [Actinomycetota bacterium]|nr:hypothetical protein [Actinomycetota bacterium]
MSTTPRLPSAVEGKAASARTIMAHGGPVREAFDKMYGTLWSRGVVDPDVKELVRLRNARVTDCGL